MPKGQSSRSGPLPDPNALKRDRDARDWTTLPEGGRQGEVPPWPLAIKANIAEIAYWAELWTTPQSVEWDRQGQNHEVALYVRKFVEASRPKSTATLVNATRQMADSLGLTIPGLLRNKWKIGNGQAEAAPRQTSSQASSRERFTVVNGTG